MTFDFPPITDATERAHVEDAIAAFVRAFYDKGMSDPLLGPVFANAIPDLESHLTIVQNFWSKSLLHTERYDGHPFAAHLNLPIEPAHFERWLELFCVSARETLPSLQADQVIAKATHMAQCFQSGLFPFTNANGRPSRTPHEHPGRG